LAAAVSLAGREPQRWPARTQRRYGRGPLGVPAGRIRLGEELLPVLIVLERSPDVEMMGVR